MAITPINYAKRNRDNRVRCPDHRAWVRKHLCLIYDKHECQGRVDAAHVRHGTQFGMGIKPGDEWCVPLCRLAHREAEGQEAKFDERYGVSLKESAVEFAAKSSALRRYLMQRIPR